MNTDNTNAIKKVLEEATGGTAGLGDRGWQAEGVERLFFDEFGAEGFRSGLVEVRHGEGARNAESVRLELELAPALAARVIALVTNTTLGEMPDLTEAEEAAIEACMVPPPATRFWAGEAILDEKPMIEEDALARRNKEIVDLILAQRKERELEKEHAAEHKISVEDVPEELNFDLPEAPL